MCRSGKDWRLHPQLQLILTVILIIISIINIFIIIHGMCSIKIVSNKAKIGIILQYLFYFSCLLFIFARFHRIIFYCVNKVHFDWVSVPIELSTYIFHWNTLLWLYFVKLKYVFKGSALEISKYKSRTFFTIFGWCSITIISYLIIAIIYKNDDDLLVVLISTTVGYITMIFCVIISIVILVMYIRRLKRVCNCQSTCTTIFNCTYILYLQLNRKLIECSQPQTEFIDLMTKETILSTVSIIATLLSWTFSIVSPATETTKQNDLTDFITDSLLLIFGSINILCDTICISLTISSNKKYYQKLCGKCHRCCFQCFSGHSFIIFKFMRQPNKSMKPGSDTQTV